MSAALELLRAAQEGDRDACELAATMAGAWSRTICISLAALAF